MLCPLESSGLPRLLGPHGRLSRLAPDVGLVPDRQESGELGLLLGELRVTGEVRPLVGIGRLVVELLVAVGIPDIPPARVSDCMIAVAVGRERRPVPGGLRLLEELADAPTLDMRRVGIPARSVSVG
jgi:hypothetical protein